MEPTSSCSILSFTRPSYWIDRSTLDIDGIRESDQKLEPRGPHVARYRMDSMAFCALINELRSCPNYRRGFIRTRQKRDESTLVIRLVDPDRFPLDYKGNHKVEVMVNRHLELEKLMWLLSTLGGAFSALGDIAVEYANRASRISWEQLRIAFMLGDPITVARCRLYIAISKIQTGELRLAKRIIRQQYRFATSSSVSDNRQLVNVCLGIWSKLKYAYECRRSKKSMVNLDRTS